MAVLAILLHIHTLIVNKNVKKLLFQERTKFVFPGYQESRLGRVHGLVCVRRSPLRNEGRSFDHRGQPQQRLSPLPRSPGPRLRALLGRTLPGLAHGPVRYRGKDESFVFSVFTLEIIF